LARLQSKHIRKINISGGNWYEQAAAMIRIELVAEGLYAYDFAAYPHKSQLPTPDIKVDINSDYKIDIKDIAVIAKDFGWRG